MDARKYLSESKQKFDAILMTSQTRWKAALLDVIHARFYSMVADKLGHPRHARCSVRGPNLHDTASSLPSTARWCVFRRCFPTRLLFPLWRGMGIHAGGQRPGSSRAVGWVINHRLSTRWARSCVSTMA